jgi:hypothetical protein
MDRTALEALVRDELVVEARRFGVKRPEVMTRVELVDEVLRLGTPNPVERKKVRGWLGVARDLIASAVEVGLNLPDAAAMIRGDVRFESLHPEQPPVATVTLAEIYGAQGHFDRALGMLDEVLEREPEHEVARRLRAKLVADRDGKRAKQGSAAAGNGQQFVAATPEPQVFAEDDEPDHPTLVPMRPVAAAMNDDDEPDHVTLMPAKPPVGALDDDEPDHVTLMPARPAAFPLDDEPDHVTLMPAKPAAFPLDDEPDHVTLMPAKPPVGALDDDEPDHVTLVPSRKPPEDDEPTTLPPAAPAVADADDGPDLPTNPPPAPADVTAASDVADAPSEDAVVFTRTAAGTAAVYFELGVAAGRADVAVLRIVEHRPRGASVERVERDLPLSGRRGTTSVVDLESGSVLRAALGRKWNGQFRATAVAAELSVAPSGVDVLWSPRRAASYDAVIGRSGLSTPTS